MRFYIFVKFCIGTNCSKSLFKKRRKHHNTRERRNLQIHAKAQHIHALINVGFSLCMAYNMIKTKASHRLHFSYGNIHSAIMPLCVFSRSACVAVAAMMTVMSMSPLSSVTIMQPFSDGSIDDDAQNSHRSNRFTPTFLYLFDM